jgi:hypothetical protein
VVYLQPPTAAYDRPPGPAGTCLHPIAWPACPASHQRLPHRQQTPETGTGWHLALPRAVLLGLVSLTQLDTRLFRLLKVLSDGDQLDECRDVLTIFGLLAIRAALIGSKDALVTCCSERGRLRESARRRTPSRPLVSAQAMLGLQRSPVVGHPEGYQGVSRRFGQAAGTKEREHQHGP